MALKIDQQLGDNKDGYGIMGQMQYKIQYTPLYAYFVKRTPSRDSRH